MKPNSHPLVGIQVPERQIELTYPLENARTESMEIPNAHQEEPAQYFSAKEAAHCTAIFSHEVQWNTSTVDRPLNETVGTKVCPVTGPDGQIVHEGNRPTAMGSLDCFQWMFSMEFLSTIVHNTNKNLCSSRIRPTTSGEILKCFGF